MGVGRGEGGSSPRLEFENFSKKGVFLVWSRKKQISPLLAPLEKFWKNPLVAPLEKILQTPMFWLFVSITDLCRY